ncbi:hypothetical protein ASG25_10555 [Rhizobium sp. Leaf384]|uniref:hypothetical protein n=1 Tax=Rhizobium sp. Leaf384 TaxID=1736358 RepID=UPI0007151F97|nr:hypothetical protein [Rhizobium sp. Leaf384]KQS79021.1 hypothetical protein ASG25_10555 [Rhizobium sp. Leaf384]
MKRLTTSWAAWSCVAAVSTFLLLNSVIPHSAMVEISSALVLGTTVAIIFRWTRDALISLRDGRQGHDFLIVGVFSIVLMILIQRVWVIWLRITDRPDHLVNSAMTAFIPWMLAWACILVLIAPDAGVGAVPPRSRVLLYVGLFAAGMASGVSILLPFILSK